MWMFLLILTLSPGADLTVSVRGFASEQECETARDAVPIATIGYATTKCSNYLDLP
jgi:hypothetical protein